LVDDLAAYFNNRDGVIHVDSETGKKTSHHSHLIIFKPIEVWGCLLFLFIFLSVDYFNAKQRK